MLTPPADWNAQIAALPQAHVLQTAEWAALKAHYGWQPDFKTWQDATGRTCAAALILQRAVPLPLLGRFARVLYVPKGPLLEWADVRLRQRVLSDLEALARRQHAIFIKIDPDVILGNGVPGTETALENPLGQTVAKELAGRGWQFSQDQIQFRNTVVIDLTHSEEQLLANMKPKMRYNVRLSERKGVQVRPGTLADLGLLYQMYAETAVRDGFVIRSEDYYTTVWSSFMQAGLAEPLIAEVAGEPVAAAVIFRLAGRAWYLYGMSREVHREKMPNSLLQWEAMRRARQSGCLSYDLWGAPDEFNESDPLWGVFRFKEGLGGQVVRTLGAWDWPVNPILYRLYTQTLPRLLDILRRRGRAATARRVQGGA